MKFDPRIKKGKMPLSPFELNKAKKFIGEFGYFANNIFAFMNLDTIAERGAFTLSDINPSDTDFKPFKDGSDEVGWSYFLPKVWTNPHEEMYGPYTLTGWCNRHELGEEIVMRLKNTIDEQHKLFVGYTPAITPTITLGNSDFSFRELFEEWEIHIDDIWQPFGMKEYKENFEE